MILLSSGNNDLNSVDSVLMGKGAICETNPTYVYESKIYESYNMTMNYLKERVNWSIVTWEMPTSLSTRFTWCISIICNFHQKKNICPGDIYTETERSAEKS